jgi:hypothetical protein
MTVAERKRLQWAREKGRNADFCKSGWEWWAACDSNNNSSQNGQHSTVAKAVDSHAEGCEFKSCKTPHKNWHKALAVLLL